MLSLNDFGFRKLVLSLTKLSEADLLLTALSHQTIAGRTRVNFAEFFYRPTVAGRIEMRCERISTVCLRN